MTDKSDIKQEKKTDARDLEANVRAEVIEDLDVPSRDEDSLRGGFSVSHCANPKPGA